MKRFVKKILIYAFFCAIIMVVPSVLVDPYNVFHWEHIRNNGVEPNKNYIKTKYIINNPDKFNGFLFGSSRVGSIHVENISDMPFYNMTCPMSTPKEQVDSVKTFIEKGVDIKTVVMGIDSLSYTCDWESHNTHGGRATYQYLDDNPVAFASLYFNPLTVLQSLSILLSDSKIEGFEHFYDYGWWCDYDRETTINWDQAVGGVGPRNYLDETLEDIREMRNVCESNGIDFILFVNPMHELTYKVAVENADFKMFLEKLVHISSYYNFSGLNDITTDNSNFIDTSHYNAYIGDMIIDVIFNNAKYDSLYSQGFGWYVDEENVDDFMNILNDQLTEPK